LWENLKGSIIFVKFGQVMGKTQLQILFLNLNKGRNKGYLSIIQNKQSLTPVSYPASIVILQNSLENKIDDVNFGNSYIAVDARRDHGQQGF
jgi:hypothetical protein